MTESTYHTHILAFAFEKDFESELSLHFWITAWLLLSADTTVSSDFLQVYYKSLESTSTAAHRMDTPPLSLKAIESLSSW